MIATARRRLQAAAQGHPRHLPAELRDCDRARSASSPSSSEERRLLLGAYFTNEYSLESVALFNPSMVLHPDQNGVPRGLGRASS